MTQTHPDPVRPLAELAADLSACTACADRFALTATAHAPRPVAWFSDKPRILIAGQAPGLRVHQSGRPFTDRSGDRLRDWMGLDEERFYDRRRIAILPMAFCFPGYDAAGADLPPPAACARIWRARLLAALGRARLTLLVGAHAQKWHLPGAGNVQATVSSWRRYAPAIYPLPHPSWRNNAWLKRNPWFESRLLPDLRRRVDEVLR